MNVVDMSKVGGEAMRKPLQQNGRSQIVRSAFSQRVLSRFRVRSKALGPLKAKRSSGEGGEEGERFQKALKGTVATTLALTQVLGNALAVHNQDLVQPLDAAAETTS